MNDDLIERSKAAIEAWTDNDAFAGAAADLLQEWIDRASTHVYER